MEKFIKKNKGITLIALVISIIVLIILAGVSISAISGQNGILNQAVNANVTIDVANTKEQIWLAILDKLDENGNYTLQDVIDSSNEVTGNDVAEVTGIVLSANGNEVNILDLIKGASDYVEDKTPPTIAVVSSSETDSITITVTANDDSGIKSYQYYLGGVLQKTLTTNEYTFSNLDSGTEYEIKVIVTDNYENYNEWSDTVSTEEEIAIIEFTINETTYYAEDGMTWSDWCESDYNTLGLFVVGDYMSLDRFLQRDGFSFIILLVANRV